MAANFLFTFLTRLPDNHTIIWVAPHLIAWLDVESIKEWLKVADSYVHAIDSERVWINLCATQNLLFSDVCRPHVSIAQEETLIG